ncbi:YgjV family protein [Halodesulfovibrio marinisediminis]|uniref:Inner membrane protein n=1 Tax=Halodesulfovibrio marinisediminis DSM 17456 TaxID=1121457 RepID=A0A1N6DJT6_9BACT|nr:YgjV family protein [Halodesulfovibrio marinisediminis]SIN71028.1 inner membrane protein [Halodesulfovibrio marinisediminis DSM 17456]
MSVFAISQMLVGVALIFDILSFQFKNRKYILLSIAAACFFMAVHFLLLEQWTATVLMAVSAVRYAVSGYTTERRWMYFFCAIAVLGTIWTYTGLVSILSFGATFVLTIAAFSKTDKRLREITFFGVALWIVHNIVVWSPSAIGLESFFFMSNVVGYYRYYMRPAKTELVLEQE